MLAINRSNMAHGTAHGTGTSAGADADVWRFVGVGCVVLSFGVR